MLARREDDLPFTEGASRREQSGHESSSPGTQVGALVRWPDLPTQWLRRATSHGCVGVACFYTFEDDFGKRSNKATGETISMLPRNANCN